MGQKRIHVRKNSLFREKFLIRINNNVILNETHRNKYYWDTIGSLEMSVCYDKLWKMLIDKRMNKTDLKDKAGISFNVLAKMGKGESVSLESLHKICRTLKCDIGDIIEFSDEKIDIM